MTIDLPFDFNSRTWWINKKSNGPGPVIAEIRQSSTTVESVRIDAGGKIYVGDDGQFDELGTEYACLSRDKALECLRDACSPDKKNTVVLDPEKKIRAMLFHSDGTCEPVSETITMDYLESWISSQFATGEPDQDGHFTVYDPSAWSAATPPSTFLRDGRGNPVEAMYGTFLLLRCRKSETTGLLELIDIDIDPMIANTGGASDPDLAYDPSHWKSCSGMTVGEFARLLLDAYPNGAKLYCCGTEPVYLHHASKAGVVNIDCDPLDDLACYEGREPEKTN